MLPISLQQLGYQSRPEIWALARLSFKRIAHDAVQIQEPWIHWRGVLEYLGCIEYARTGIRELPHGRWLELKHAIPAKYHSISLVFMSQALSDNLAVWLTSFFRLPVKGGERQLLRQHFRRELQKRAPAAFEVLCKHEPYLRELNQYRQAWIHTLSGGAVLWSDTDPFSDPSANKQAAVPIDPALNMYETSYQKRAEESVKKHGRFLYPISEFADRIADGATCLTFDFLTCCLRCSERPPVGTEARP